MQLLTAERIHDGYKWMPAGTTLVIADDGVITDILDHPADDTQVLDGWLVPGFVNAHCHLELSHMKGVVPRATGLIPFLKSIPQHRNDHSDEQKWAARSAAFTTMLESGVVAVGDIANTADTKDLRESGNMHFHTFVEALGFTHGAHERAFAYAKGICDELAMQNGHSSMLRQSVTPHAPYSVSADLFRLIGEAESGGLISVHNQESMDEDLYYRAKQGHVPDLLGLFGIDDSYFQPTAKSSLQSYLPWLGAYHDLLFVHNTYATKEDVKFAQGNTRSASWCLCPNANMYIEGCLPDVAMLRAEGAHICVGTDSLASNDSLSILAELQTLKRHFPDLEWEELLGWATANGARALRMEDVIGSIAPCKKPGLVHIALNAAGEPVSSSRIL